MYVLKIKLGPKEKESWRAFKPNLSFGLNSRRLSCALGDSCALSATLVLQPLGESCSRLART